MIVKFLKLVGFIIVKVVSIAYSILIGPLYAIWVFVEALKDPDYYATLSEEEDQVDTDLKAEIFWILSSSDVLDNLCKKLAWWKD